MKKIFLIVLIIPVLVTGCLKKTEEKQEVKETVTPEPTPVVEPSPVQEEVIPEALSKIALNTYTIKVATTSAINSAISTHRSVCKNYKTS